MLGVCLGHQAIGAAFGGKVVRAPHLMHGKTSQVQHDGKNHLPAACFSHDRDALPLPDCAKKKIAQRAGSQRLDQREDGTRTIMGLRHRKFPVEGVQFHPESVLTEEGKKLVENFLRI